MKWYGRDQGDWDQNEATTVKMDGESLMKRELLEMRKASCFETNQIRGLEVNDQ